MEEKETIKIEEYLKPLEEEAKNEEENKEKQKEFKDFYENKIKKWERTFGR